VWAQAQRRWVGHRSLVTHDRVLSEYNEDLIFAQDYLKNPVRLLNYHVLCARIRCNWQVIRSVSNLRYSLKITAKQSKTTVVGEHFRSFLDTLVLVGEHFRSFLETQFNNVVSYHSMHFVLFSNFSSRSLTLSENRYGLRTILSPSELPSKFMKIAHSNTMKNIETCGVLFGKLVRKLIKSKFCTSTVDSALFGRIGPARFCPNYPEMLLAG